MPRSPSEHLFIPTSFLKVNDEALTVNQPWSTH